MALVEQIDDMWKVLGSMYNLWPYGSGICHYAFIKCFSFVYCFCPFLFL